MSADRLDALLSRFSVSARMFHSGALCGVNAFAAREGFGHLHLLRGGSVLVKHRRRRSLLVDVPSLLFYPRPHEHTFVTDDSHGADLTCALVEFGSGSLNPVAQALPAFVCLPLTRLQSARPVLDALFAEAFSKSCGRQAALDRLFEVVLIHILRELLSSQAVSRGLLAGLAEPRLARSLIALHERSSEDWTLQSLAAQAGMSRSAYAASFKQIVGVGPAEYLARWRVTLAQDLLRRGRPLKLIAGEVGYGSSAALSRAFKALCGASPRQWRDATRECSAEGTT